MTFMPTSFRRITINSQYRIQNRLFASKSDKKKLIFLGTPKVSEVVLNILYQASQTTHSNIFEISSVVTQPPTQAGRNKKLTKSPVHELAEKLSLPLLYPETAKDIEFLEKIENIKPDVCITAAYGNYLPKRFLAAPKFGTVNIHPSLLPLYRGAAPVQRCLENGDSETGISILYSVSKMDAGPILYQEKYPLTGHENAAQVLNDTFQTGANKLLQLLPSIFDGTIKTQEQDHSKATAADKISVSEGLIDFSNMTARQIYNKARGFSEWPGIYSTFYLGNTNEVKRIKITSSVVLDKSQVESLLKETPTYSNLPFAKIDKTEVFVVPCADNTYLGLLEIQPPSKKPMNAKAVLNGLRGVGMLQWIDPKTLPNYPHF